MAAARRPQRQALTLVEALLIVAILAVLLALTVSAVQRVRESAHRTRCQSNLRQLALAVQHFHDARETLPTYFGIYPAAKDLVTAEANPEVVYGGWFAHLLPFAGEEDLHRSIEEQIRSAGHNTTISRTVTTAATGLWVPPVPGTPDRWEPHRRLVVDVPGTPQWVPLQQQNGYVVFAVQRVGERAHYEPADAVFVAGTPGRPGHWDPPGSGPRTVTTDEPGGIWLPEAKGRRFDLLICPSDPSTGSDAEAGAGHVYLRTHSPPWGSTNYLANWWALAGGEDAQAGWLAPPQPLAAITDGLSSTVLFAEGYAWCDGLGRIALYPPNQHNFGLSQALPRDRNRVDIDGESFTFGSFEHGYPNTWMFQLRPLPRPASDCPPGGRCCNRWVAQSGHAVMNVALLDGSVRSLSARLSPDTWRRALQPRDGDELGNDW